MTVIIKKTDSRDTVKRKIEKLQKCSEVQKQKSFQDFCGSLKGVFKEDAVTLQRKWRAEWR